MLSSRASRIVGVSLGALAWVAPAAGADDRAGGASAPERPEIAELRCDPAASARPRCPPGALLSLRGERLETVHSAVFLGQRGTTDDRRTSIRSRSPHRALVRIPQSARTGPVRVLSNAVGRSRASAPLELLGGAPPPAPESDDGTFPVQGPVDFGTETNRLGGGRGHQGQGLFAPCGTPIVAALGGTVEDVGTDGTQGNYVVVRARDRSEQAYLHMLRPADVSRGESLTSGQEIGAVGETGNARGCHLHFELWSAPGRFTGGRVIDPLPKLRLWRGAG